MSTPTPWTDAVYLEHRHWANEDEATEAIEDLRDLARKLERELAIELERATHYRDEWQKERAKARALRDALQNLLDEQNDAPLETRRSHWQMAMDEAGLALAVTEESA